MVLSSTEETHILQKIRQKKDAINYVSVLLVNDPIEVFQNRERRYGKTSEQINVTKWKN